MQQQIALAEGCIANAYNNANFLAGGQSISQINSFFPQASAVKMRTSKSGAWLDKIGSYVYGYNGDAAVVSLLSQRQWAVLRALSIVLLLLALAWRRVRRRSTDQPMVPLQTLRRWMLLLMVR